LGRLFQLSYGNHSTDYPTISTNQKENKIMHKSSKLQHYISFLFFLLLFGGLSQNAFAAEEIKSPEEKRNDIQREVFINSLTRGTLSSLIVTESSDSARWQVEANASNGDIVGDAEFVPYEFFSYEDEAYEHLVSVVENQPGVFSYEEQLVVGVLKSDGTTSIIGKFIKTVLDDGTTSEIILPLEGGLPISVLQQKAQMEILIQKEWVDTVKSNPARFRGVNFCSGPDQKMNDLFRPALFEPEQNLKKQESYYREALDEPLLIKVQGGFEECMANAYAVWENAYDNAFTAWEIDVALAAAVYGTSSITCLAIPNPPLQAACLAAALVVYVSSLSSAQDTRDAAELNADIQRAISEDWCEQCV